VANLGPPATFLPQPATASSSAATPTPATPANESGSWWSVDGFVPSYVSQIDVQMSADSQATGVGVGESVATVAPEPSSFALL